MEITEAQYRHIALCLPTQRNNVTLDNLQVLNAILYVASTGANGTVSSGVRQQRHYPFSHESVVDEWSDETQPLTEDFGYAPVVPPKHNRCAPWATIKLLY
jgi:hypothetical protein